MLRIRFDLNLATVGLAASAWVISCCGNLSFRRDDSGGVNHLRSWLLNVVLNAQSALLVGLLVVGRDLIDGIHALAVLLPATIARLNSLVLHLLQVLNDEVMDAVS